MVHFCECARMPHMKLKPILRTVAILCLATVFSHAGISTLAKVPSSTSLPNIVFILVDDLGSNDVGCFGSTFHETPHIDQLASEGMRFSNAYAASPVCSPTRASILTGKYPGRVNFWRASPTENLPHEEVTLPEALQEAGYRTAHLGKWHMQLHGEKGKGHEPQGHGYDVNIAGHDSGGPGSYFFPYQKTGSPRNDVPDMEDGKPGDFLTDALTSKAIKFMQETTRSTGSTSSPQAGSGQAQQPFFVSLWYYAVHTPVMGKEEEIAKYQKKAEALELAADSIQEGERYSRKQQDNPIYAAMVESMDENVGRILDYLQESGLADNTIVVFMSDNGGLSTISSEKGGVTSSLPLRGGKAWVYEGGIRVPMIIKWPGVTPKGRLCDTPVISTDVYPTLLEMVGLPLRPKQHLDGLSLKPLLTRDQDTLDRDALYFHFPQDHHINSMGPSAAVRAGDYKLVERFSDGAVELFNLKEDEGEHHDLSETMPEMTESLKIMLHQWRKETDAYMPAVQAEK